MMGRRLDSEEWYDILMIPYLNAVKKYHEYEHLQIYSFSSILKRILDTAVNHHFRSERAEKRMPEGGFVSLDYTMEGDNPFSEHQVEAWLINAKQNLCDIMDDLEAEWEAECGSKKFIVPITCSYTNGEMKRDVIIETDRAETAALIAIRDFQHNGWVVDTDYKKYRQFRG